MRYISTRNKEISLSSSEGNYSGISKDGGIICPQILPKNRRPRSYGEYGIIER